MLMLPNIIFTLKSIGKNFYNKNTLERIFTIKMHWKGFLL